ncbi:MAG TPA: hypothetical protein VME63_00645 [Dyella sp.]|uniref:hypothetical protein n=1 Tax=Dyella sp. TaxID=1869338 RepID=UPI002B55DCC3|nr:hypothetical protein [Dyella sp.]HTV83884.1 hypothetical protein [Dyella sp.]
MTSTMSQQNILNAIQAIQNAANLLTSQISDATDPVSAIKLNHAYQQLNACLSQLLQLQNVRDDATFKSSVANIKAQTNTLQTDEKSIKGLISDVGTATKVLGYVADAVGFIAKIA